MCRGTKWEHESAIIRDFGKGRLSARGQGRLVYKDLRYKDFVTRLDDIPAVAASARPSSSHHSQTERMPDVDYCRAQDRAHQG
jgi:hypothetical protein